MKTFANTDLLALELLGALITFNADPTLVETEEDASELAQTIGLKFEEITDADEITDAKAKLDLSENEVKHIYSFAGGLVCFAHDWE